MKKLLLAVVAVAAFGAPQAATKLGADIGARSDVAVAAYAGSDKSVFRTAGTSDSAATGSLVDVSAVGAEPSTYALMFLGLGLIGLSLRSRRNTR
jgi:PEP-CTERM motif